MNIWLVKNRPVFNTVTKGAGDNTRVICEFGGRVTVKPAAVLLQGLRKVPVIQAEPWPQAFRKEPINQPVIKIETAVLDASSAERRNARPRRREPIGRKVAA